MPPKKTNKPKVPPVRVFETIPIADMPDRTKASPHEADYRAAMAQADANPDSAVIIYDSMGDGPDASSYASILRRWLKSQKLGDKYDAVKRQSKVYVWRTL